MGYDNWKKDIDKAIENLNNMTQQAIKELEQEKVKLIAFELFNISEEEIDLAYKAIENEGIVKAVAKPILPFYGGKIWVLTNKNTASACEPLVDFLKVNNLATIIGEKTAGKMLSAKSFSIDENYELYLPIANYYTAQNFWIEQNGVEPNIAVKSENALDKVSELISK